MRNTDSNWLKRGSGHRYEEFSTSGDKFFGFGRWNSEADCLAYMSAATTFEVSQVVDKTKKEFKVSLEGFHFPK